MELNQYKLNRTQKKRKREIKIHTVIKEEKKGRLQVEQAARDQTGLGITSPSP